MTTSTLPFSTAMTVGRMLNLPCRIAAPWMLPMCAREGCEPWLFNHVVRSWFYGVRLAQARSHSPDQENLAVVALLHDLGLARNAATDLARDFAIQHDMGERRAEVIWDAVALHSTPSIAHFKGVDVTCCQIGIACDYGGLGYEVLSEEEKQTVLTASPRLGMKEALRTCLCGIAKHHPQTTWDNFVAEFGERYVPGYQRPSFVDLLLHSPFAE